MVALQAEYGFNQSQLDKTTIMIADDHPLLRQALVHVLEKQADFEIIAEVDDGEEAVRLATELIPNVVIMDIGMPKLNGLEATRQIKAKCQGVAVLVLTVHDDKEHILGILEAGADGYLTKSVFGTEVIQAVRSVVAGETVLSKSISKQVLEHAVRHMTKPVHSNSCEKITSRELEILEMSAKGMSNKEIAEILDIGLRTVKSHLAEIYSKLNVGSRTGAVIAALKIGIIRLDDLR